MSMEKLDGTYLADTGPPHIKRVQAVRLVSIKMEHGNMNKTQACKLVALVLKMSVSSVRNQIRKYKKRGVEELFDLPRSGRPPVYFEDDVDKAIENIQKRGEHVTPRRLVTELQEMQKNGPAVSNRHARRLLRARNMSPKKAQHANVAAAKPHAVYRWRSIYFPLILALRLTGYTVAVADEMVVSQDANGKVVYWSKVGVPVKVPYIGDHDKFVSLGITTEPNKKGRARRCHVTAEKANTASFINLLDKAFKEFGRLVVIVDRVGWHNSAELKQFLRGMNGKIIVILLPVGSAYLNAKEQDWHQTKISDFYSEYYSSIEKKRLSTVEYLDTELNPNINIWKYLIRSPHAYRKGIRRRKRHYGEQGPLQYTINKYLDPEIAKNPFPVVDKRGNDFICNLRGGRKVLKIYVRDYRRQTARL